ncbi:MAG: hypothetical protein NZ602_17185 [Thermoguttaceae bacterium]|nr:hypothetical protein [Thermoguttaceae bacterium]MDW8038995.1 hypothetical protein [Thermoguttaceae bacterium]
MWDPIGPEDFDHQDFDDSPMAEKEEAGLGAWELGAMHQPAEAIWSSSAGEDLPGQEDFFSFLEINPMPGGFDIHQLAQPHTDPDFLADILDSLALSVRDVQLPPLVDHASRRCHRHAGAGCPILADADDWLYLRCAGAAGYH